MQPSEALNTTAQIAVTLAGFAGVVVAFRTRSVHEWTSVDKFRLQILLSNSALPFLLSILAMVLLATTLDERMIWRLCSIIGFVLTILAGQLLSHIYRAFSRDELKTSGSKPWIFYLSGFFGVTVTVLQIYNVIRLQTFWPFFAMIGTWLSLAMVQFVLLVTAKHQSES